MGPTYVANSPLFRVDPNTVASGLVSSSTRGEQSEFDSLLKVCADYAGTSDVLALVGTGISGTSASYGSMSWREFV